MAAFSGQTGSAAPGESSGVLAAPAPPAMVAPPATVVPMAAAVEAVAAPPAMAVSMGAAPPAAPPEDDLAASPWHKANNPGLNRDLLPSAMVTSAPEPSPASKKAGKAVGPEEPSRTPWIIVGVLVLVALVSGVAVFFIIQGKRGPGGLIAVPAGQGSNSDDTPADTTAPSASASATATARAAPVIRPVAPVVKQPTKPLVDDPYQDVPSSPNRVRNPTPSPTPTAAKNRVFGSDPY